MADINNTNYYLSTRDPSYTPPASPIKLTTILTDLYVMWEDIKTSNELIDKYFVTDDGQTALITCFESMIADDVDGGELSTYFSTIVSNVTSYVNGKADGYFTGDKLESLATAAINVKLEYLNYSSYFNDALKDDTIGLKDDIVEAISDNFEIDGSTRASIVNRVNPSTIETSISTKLGEDETFKSDVSNDVGTALLSNSDFHKAVAVKYLEDNIVNYNTVVSTIASEYTVRSDDVATKIVTSLTNGDLNTINTGIADKFYAEKGSSINLESIIEDVVTTKVGNISTDVNSAIKTKVESDIDSNASLYTNFISNNNASLVTKVSDYVKTSSSFSSNAFISSVANSVSGNLDINPIIEDVTSQALEEVTDSVLFFLNKKLEVKRYQEFSLSVIELMCNLQNLHNTVHAMVLEENVMRRSLVRESSY
jgi:hypothetical protein